MLQDFKNKRVTVMGLGLYAQGTGIEAVKFFLRHGAKVTVTDLRSTKELSKSVQELVRYYSRLPSPGLRPSSPKGRGSVETKSSPHGRGEGEGKKQLTFILGKHRQDDFKNTDLIFQNPSVPADSPYLRIATKYKIPIVNDWSIFLSLHNPKIFIGVTGTRGKSTTTALIHEIMKKQYKKVYLAGNLGVSPLSFVDQYKGEPIVAELSSWLLHHFPSVKKSPNIAVVTNIMNDHMDKYKNAQEYIADKENVFKFQDKKGIVILNYDNKITRAMSKRVRGKVLWFSLDKRVPRWVDLGALQILGEHNRANALAAGLAAEAAGVTRRDIADGIKNFHGLPNRLEFVRKVQDVKYYNDTTATTPEAAIAALRALGYPHPNPSPLGRGKGEGKKHIVLIAGGADKKLEYKELAEEIKKYCKAVVLLPGRATDKIKKSLAASSYPLASFAKNMAIAVKQASDLAKEGDIVLLSPAAASFGLFKNEFDRGNQFVACVKKL